MKKFKRKIFGTKVTLFADKSRAETFKYKSFRDEFKGDNIKEELSYHLYPERYIDDSLTRELLRSSDSRAILLVHGGILNREWVYEDNTFFGKKYIPIQNWINKYDGKYDDLFILACGGNCEIKSKKSIVIHAKEDFSLDELARHQIKMHVYIPRKGYI
ncbi:MAG: hypothetical protein Q8O84_02995 [Nanoarchaeota archaeon]|nr:hypothetical protein [Nanoarchaeota archaeon]